MKDPTPMNVGIDSDLVEFSAMPAVERIDCRDSVLFLIYNSACSDDAEDCTFGG